MDVRHLVDNDDEFVAAESGDRIILPHALLEAFGNILQKNIPDNVAERVVDRLKVVQVEDHQGKQVVMPVFEGQGLLQAVKEQLPVGEAGQGIVIRLMLEFLFRISAFGNLLFKKRVHLDQFGIEGANFLFGPFDLGYVDHRHNAPLGAGYFIYLGADIPRALVFADKQGYLIQRSRSAGCSFQAFLYLFGCELLHHKEVGPLFPAFDLPLREAGQVFEFFVDLGNGAVFVDDHHCAAAYIEN